MMRLLIYLSKFVEDSKTGSPSVKRFGLALAVTVLCGIMIGIFSVTVFLAVNSPPIYTVELIKEFLSTLVYIAGSVLAAVTTGYLVDKAQTRKRDNVDEPDKTTTNTSSDDS